MKIPTRVEAERMMMEATGMNPGPWVEHAGYAARAAETIARELGDMDADTAYILALLHDIGRRFGKSKFRHMTDGYRYLTGLGYPDAAKVCITHGFPLRDIDMVLHEKDVSDTEWEFAREFLAAVEYDDYDRLVQLADIVAMPHGYVLIEKRFVDVALRYGTTAHTAERWRAFFAVRDGFEKRLGKSVYSLLPGVVENTFGVTA